MAGHGTGFTEKGSGVTRFEPKGDKALWRKVYDFAVDLEPGDLITWEQFEEILGYDPGVPGMGAGRQPVYMAARRMLVDHDRTLISVRNQGYRVAHAHEQEGMARSAQRAARRKIRRGMDLAVHVDISQLTAGQRRSVEAVAHVLAAQNAMLARHEDRITEVEEVQAKVAHVQAVADDRIAALEAALLRLGIPIPRTEVILGETVG